MIKGNPEICMVSKSNKSGSLRVAVSYSVYSNTLLPDITRIWLHVTRVLCHILSLTVTFHSIEFFVSLLIYVKMSRVLLATHFIKYRRLSCILNVGHDSKSIVLYALAFPWQLIEIMHVIPTFLAFICFEKLF